VEFPARHECTGRRCAALRYIQDQRRPICFSVTIPIHHIENISKKVISGALEPQFYAALLKGLELDAKSICNRDDKANWPALRSLFEYKFGSKTLSDWEKIFTGTDACVAPVRPLVSRDLRPYVELTDTPGLPVDDSSDCRLPFGKGSEVVLNQWLGWRERQNYVYDARGNVESLKARSKM
jgi:alpha-methylacyl-CoA racemase